MKIQGKIHCRVKVNNKDLLMTYPAGTAQMTAKSLKNTLKLVRVACLRGGVWTCLTGKGLVIFWRRMTAKINAAAA